jgi:hypothetical protein
MVVCTKCGQINDEDSNFCEECGNQIERENATKSYQTISNNLNINKYIQQINWKAIKLGIVTYFIALIIVGFVAHFSPGIVFVPFFSGIVAGFIAGGNKKNGMIHGVVANMVQYIMILLVLTIVLLPSGVLNIFIGIIILLIELSIASAGGAVGSIIKTRTKQ